MPVDPGPVRGFEKIVHHVCRVLNAIASILLFVLMVLGAADVIGRYLLNAPIIGTMERGQVILALMVFLSWGYTQIKKGHVNVELFISKFPPHIRAITDFITTLFMLVFTILIVWYSAIMAIETHYTGEKIYVIHWPLAPFQFFVPLGGFFLCLVFILEAIQFFHQMKGRG